jgi:hypothetical protein
MTFQIASESDQNVKDVRVTGSIKNGMILFLLVVLMSQATSANAAQNQVFYLHKWVFEDSTDYSMDESQPTQYSYPLGLEYHSYYWRTVFVTPDMTIETSTWAISLWLGYTVQSTGLAVSIGYVFEGTYHAMAEGNITGIRQFPKKYVLGLTTSEFQIPAGGALALKLVPIRNTLISTPNVVLYLDSDTTPSQVSVEPATPIPEFLNGTMFAVSVAMLIIGMNVVLRKKS